MRERPASHFSIFNRRRDFFFRNIFDKISFSKKFGNENFKNYVGYKIVIKRSNVTNFELGLNATERHNDSASDARSDHLPTRPEDHQNHDFVMCPQGVGHIVPFFYNGTPLTNGTPLLAPIFASVKNVKTPKFVHKS